jgi:hypothetical protein
LATFPATHTGYTYCDGDLEDKHAVNNSRLSDLIASRIGSRRIQLFRVFEAYTRIESWACYDDNVLADISRSVAEAMKQLNNEQQTVAMNRSGYNDR